jgi:hypothetical protein
MVRQAHHPEHDRRVNLKFQYSMTKTFDPETSLEPLFLQPLPIDPDRLACKVHQRLGNPPVGAQQAVHVAAFLGRNRRRIDPVERLLDARFEPQQNGIEP